EERLLEEVGGDAPVPHHPHQEAEDALLVALNELGESPLVAPVDVGGDELLVREGGHEGAWRAVGGTSAGGPYCEGAEAALSRAARGGGFANDRSGRKRRPRPRRSAAPAWGVRRRTWRHARRTGRPGSTSSKATQAPGARCGR